MSRPARLRWSRFPMSPTTTRCGPTPSTRASAPPAAAHPDGHRHPGPGPGRCPRQDATTGPLVAGAGHHLRRVLGVRGLRHLAGVLRRELLLHPLPVPVLLALPQRQLRGGIERPRATGDVLAALAGIADS